MVCLNQVLAYAKKISKPPRRYLQKGFLDKLRFHVRAGTGGSGLSKYGGIGGKGGDVYVRAQDDSSLKELSKYIRTKTLIAGTGFDSQKNGILGAAGEDLIINVPTGVIVYHENGNLIGEVNEHNKKLVIALGGVGGCEETDYSGQRGESHSLILDLKLISDVALVGFPNAGKSTLIRTVSNAKPKVAEYPFTTVRPHLGHIKYPDFREITIADLPGLIEGAHKNIGMGYNFLKHLERSKMLLFVVDIQGFRLSSQYEKRNCVETLLLLNREIELYKPELLNFPAMLVLNKMDSPNAREIYSKIRSQIEDLESASLEYSEDIRPQTFLEFKNILTLSLINKDNEEINKLKQVIRDNLDKIQEDEDLKLETEIPEYKLVNKLKRQLKLTAPTLV